jgi:hypothetical protein
MSGNSQFINPIGINENDNQLVVELRYRRVSVTVSSATYPFTSEIARERSYISTRHQPMP